MFRITRGHLLCAIVVLVTLCETRPVRANSWTNPVQPPADCKTSAMAINSSGIVVTAGYFDSGPALRDYAVEVCTSAGGAIWRGPETIGVGVTPAVAIASDGRVIVVWQAGLLLAPHIEARVKSPRGSWSVPVALSTQGGVPAVGVDNAGNAIAAWAPDNFTQAVEFATLPADGDWSPPTVLASGGGAVSLATNYVGEAIAAWRTASSIEAASGSVLHGFDELPVAVGVSSGDASTHGAPKIAINGGGAASLAWESNSNIFVVVRSIDATWSQPTALATNGSGVGTAIDGAGNAIVAFGQPQGAGIATAIARLAVGGEWSKPSVVSAPDDRGLAAVRGDASGTFIVTWITNAGAVSALTIDPTGNSDEGTVVGAGPFMGLAVRPGIAALRIGAGFVQQSVK